MKGRKTLLFMLWTPTSFIVYFLACWILISATFTIWDEPFRYGTWPDAVEAAEGAFVNLPGSLWKLVTALSIITEEIISDLIFSYRLCLFIILLALTFSYREARSSRNGITTERQTWMQWYDCQKLIKAQRGAYETPPLSEHIPGGTYFISARRTVTIYASAPASSHAGHFVCWFTLFALPILFDGSGFVRLTSSKALFLAAIFTLGSLVTERREAT